MDMNVFSFSMPNGLSDVSHCRMAQPHEQWLTDPICFHTVLPDAAAQLRRPYPESDAEKRADCGDESGPSVVQPVLRGAGPCGHRPRMPRHPAVSDSECSDSDDSTEQTWASPGGWGFLDEHGRSLSTAQAWDRTDNPEFIPPTELLWARNLVVDRFREQLTAMRAVLTRCSCPRGMPYSHDLTSNAATPRPCVTLRCQTCKKPPPVNDKRWYGTIEQPDWDGNHLENWEMKRDRHVCSDVHCTDRDHPTRGYSGDICLLLQQYTRDVDRAFHPYAHLRQYMLSCTVESTVNGKVSLVAVMGWGLAMSSHGCVGGPVSIL